MNIIRLTGGLGNQMFAYALYLKFKKLNKEACFDDFTEYEGRENARIKNLGVFGIDYPVCTRDEYEAMTDSKRGFFNKVLRHIRGRKASEYTEKGPEYDAAVIACENVYIKGYFQSEKYFEDIKADVISNFKFLPEVVNEALTMLEEQESAQLPQEHTCPDSLEDALNCEGQIPVSVHIRRGDYLDVPQLYGDICTEEYYGKALKYISQKVKNPRFLVFSNDTEWAQNWALDVSEKYDYNITVFENEDEDKGYIDMCLMSLCSHNIIANSSFSWWGAYLNENPSKIVVAPSKWVNGKNQEDIYTADMVRL